VSVTGIVLAGGRSSRFGGAKLEAELDGVALVQHAIAALARVADEVLVAGPAPPGSMVGIAGDRVPMRSIADRVPFEGPLAALAGALEAARGEIAVVAGGDMPRLVPEVLRAMVDHMAAGRFDAVILGSLDGDDATQSARRREVPASSRRRVLPLALRVRPAARAAREALAAGHRSMHALLDRLTVDELAPEAWERLDPLGGTLRDVDTPADLDRLGARTTVDQDR
jgi:molybdopterin-guanine dinucleotide biosynthesis protein A